MKRFDRKTRRPAPDRAGTGTKKTRKPERKRIEKPARKKPWRRSGELIRKWIEPKEVLEWERRLT